MTEPAIETRGVGRVLGETVQHRALDGIDLRIDPGEFVVLTGTSGSGKSTLLYLLGALDLPTDGQVRVLGRDIATLSDAERTALRGTSLGFVFQFHFLLDELTAAENVALPMWRAGVRRSAALARARETLDELDIGALADRRPSQMSGGQQQRVAIARAVAHRPAVLLADEPTGSLDSLNSERVLALLERLNTSHDLTIVMVTHDEGVAARARRRLVLRDGRLVRDERRDSARPGAPSSE